MDKYSFENLRVHTEAIRRDAQHVFKARSPMLREAFAEFSRHFMALQEQPKSLARNVRLLFAARFINHVYSAVLLVEAGMYSDALTCERTAIESLAGYRLLCVDPQSAEEYERGNFPKPVKVRERLEKLGYADEVKHIYALYSSASGVTHLSRENERFSVVWRGESDGKMQIGGSFAEKDLSHMLELLSALLRWFVSPLAAMAS